MCQNAWESKEEKMMDEEQKVLEKLKLQLWDIEEENRVLYRNIEKQKEALEAKEQKIKELEEKYTDLQNIVHKNLWLVCKRIIIKAGKKMIDLFKKF